MWTRPILLAKKALQQHNMKYSLVLFTSCRQISQSVIQARRTEPYQQMSLLLLEGETLQ